MSSCTVARTPRARGKKEKNKPYAEGNWGSAKDEQKKIIPFVCFVIGEVVRKLANASRRAGKDGRGAAKGGVKVSVVVSVSGE